jgi:RNA polymerase sigma-70 factor (ECF subfamily)
VATAAPEIPDLARDQAFESLYRRHVKDVYRYALALLRNPDDAEDVTQTTFLNAYRAYQRGVEIEKPHNWLIKITHNVARTRYASASRRVKEVPLEDHVARLAVPEAEQPDVVGVLRALGRLPFNQRAALVMRELEGRTYAEISDTIGVSVSAVETLIFRARKSLRVRASALRSLAAVPLPPSLTQFFEGGGGLLAGGGTVAGTGFLVKAGVAILAAALGTGVGGDRGRLAAAAAQPGTSFAAAQSSRSGENGPKAQQVLRHGVRSGQRVARNSAVARPSATGQAEGVVATVGAAPGTLSGPVSEVAATSSSPTSSVQQVVAAPVAALPIPTPSLPPAPVAVPPVPLPPPPLPLP